MVATPTSTLSILVADDEEGIRQLLTHWLERAGYRVTCVDCGQEAARALRARAYDLVITDIVMPDGDGFELITEFRRAQPTTRILAISGGGKYLQGADCLRMAKGLGAHGAVMKPFTREQLLAGIDAVLGSVAPTPPTA